ANHLLQTDESSAADKENVGCIHRGEFLVRVLASALGRNIGDGSFENLQQCLLHTFTRNIAGNGWVLVLAADLVDFVDVDDSGLGAAYVAIRGLQELKDDVFHVFADVPSFG